MNSFCFLGLKKDGVTFSKFSGPEVKTSIFYIIYPVLSSTPVSLYFYIVSFLMLAHWLYNQPFQRWPFLFLSTLSPVCSFPSLSLLCY